jgi:FtsH-binding integral membrane protein
MRPYDQAPNLAGFSTALADRATDFLTLVYGWMCAGLAITAAAAWYVASSPAIIHAISTNGALFWTLAITQIALVFVLSARVQQLSSSTAALLFVVYAIVTGATLSFVLRVFTGESVAGTFLVTAGTFAGLTIYGNVTKRDLGAFGQFVFMGLLGLILTSVVGVFWHSGALQFALSVLGVAIFSGLTAYDTQRLKLMAFNVPADHAPSYAIVGPLALYLDFTNLFLFLLRFMGERRDS